MSASPDAVGPLIHLRTLPPFRTLSAAQVGLLALEAEEVGIPGDAWLVRPGEVPSGIFLILDGYVRVIQQGQDRILEPMNLVGYPDVLTSRHDHRGIRAETDVTALRLGTDELRDLCERYFAILAALLTNMADEVVGRPSAWRKALVGGERSSPLPFGTSLDRVGRMVALQRTPVLPRESMDALAELSARVDRIDLSAGEPAWDPEEHADGFFVVCWGSLGMEGRDGTQLVAGPGSAPGFPETLSGRSYGRVADAREGTTLLRVGIDPLMDVAEDHFELGWAILGRMAGWLG